MLVFFGDHGEVMTEHDSWFDHAGLYDSVTHVPLLVWAPGRVPAVTTSAMVALVDVFPTLLELLDLPPVPGIDGRSLLPLLRGEVTGHRDAVVLSEATWQAARALRTENWKLVEYRAPTLYGRQGVELYRVGSDPHEQHNLASRHPGVVDALTARLHAWVEAKLQGRPDPVDVVLRDGLPAVARLHDVVAGRVPPRARVGSGRP